MSWKVMAVTAATLLIVWLIYSAGHEDGRIEGKLEISQLEVALGKARAEAQAAKDEQQRQLTATINRMNDEHSQAVAQLQSDAASGRAESDSLRGELSRLQDRLRNQPAGNPSPGFQPSAATKAAMVLSDLLSSCSGTRSELAGALDQSYARGRAVEKQYDMIRGQ